MTRDRNEPRANPTYNQSLSALVFGQQGSMYDNRSVVGSSWAGSGPAPIWMEINASRIKKLITKTNSSPSTGPIW